MRFFLVLIAFLATIVMGVPLEERSTTRVYGNKVAVVSGIIINEAIKQCFQNSGVDIAKAYAAAIADQWDNYQNTHGGTSWIHGVEAQWATSNTNTLYCSTFDAIYTFGTQYSANLFATWVRNLMGNTKRDELLPDHRFSLGDLTPDVYVSGIDLPADHHYFGSEDEKTVGALTKRTWGSCSNNKCGFSFTRDQTGICRDTSFPVGNKATC